MANEERIGEAESQGYKYFGVLELNKILYQETKRKVKDFSLKRILLLGQTNLREKPVSH